MKFVYDAKTGDFRYSDDWRVHHGDLIDQMGLDPEYAERVLLYPNSVEPRYVLGEDIPEWGGVQISGHDQLPPEYVQGALNAFKNIPKTAAGPGLYGDNRYVWLIDYKGQLRFGEAGQHHMDQNWAGDEIAEGDVYVGFDPNKGEATPGQNTIRLLRYDWNYDGIEALHRAWDAWDQAHPDLQITKSEKLAPEPAEYEAWDEDPWSEGLTNHASYDIIGGMKITSFSHNTLASDQWVDPTGQPWTVYQMESGEYDNHHAIIVDRNHNRLYLNYHGHHGPLMDAATNAGHSYESFMGSVMGHYRLEPSQDEPFGEGWGFHNGYLKPEEEEALSHYLREREGVPNLEDAWVSNKYASYEWIDVCDKTVSSNVSWKAVMDFKDKKLYVWGTCGDESHHYDKLAKVFGEEVLFKTGNIKKASGLIQSEGTYMTPAYIVAPGAKGKEKFRELLDKALAERFTAAEKETHFKTPKVRFMVTTDDEVLAGEFKTHYDLIADYIGTKAANLYKQSKFNVNDEYPLVAGGFVDCGIIRIIHSPGEPDYDPKKIAKLVFDNSLVYGDYFTTGETIYEDWRDPARPKYKFTV